MDPTDSLFDIGGSSYNYISGQVGIIIISNIGNTVAGPQKGIYQEKGVFYTTNRVFLTFSQRYPIFGGFKFGIEMGDPRKYVRKKMDTPNQIPKKRRIQSALQQYSGKFNHQLNLIKTLEKFKNVVLLPWYFLEIVQVCL